jgi:hypothetical protein
VNLFAIVKQLKKERDRAERQLHGLNAALVAFASVYGGTTKPKPKRHKMSAAARARISAAQKARWARQSGRMATKAKRHVSVTSRRKMAAAQRVRWAKVRANLNAKQKRDGRA